MNEKQARVYELLKEFIDIADKHNLKYMMMYGLLIGIKRHNGFIPWDDDIDLVIPKETLDFLIEHYPSKIYTPENGNSPLLIPKFTNDSPDNEDAVFLDLFLSIPTTLKRVKKFLSLKNKIRLLHTFTHRKIFKRLWGMNLLKFFSLWTWMFKKLKINDAYDDLYVENGDKELVLYSLFNKVTYKNTYSRLDYCSSINAKFHDLNVKIPSNWEEILVQTYGENWRIPVKYKHCEHYGLYDLKMFMFRKKK